MSASRSESSSQQSAIEQQSEIAQEIGASATVINLPNVAKIKVGDLQSGGRRALDAANGGRGADGQVSGLISIDRSGIDSQGIQAVIGQITGAAGQAIDRVVGTQQQAVAAIADIGRSQAAGQTEAGRIIEKLIMPALILGGLLIFLLLRRK